MKDMTANQDALLDKLKTGSKIIAGICFITIPVFLVKAVLTVLETGTLKNRYDLVYDTSFYYLMYCRKALTFVILAAIMLIAALCFRRIAKDGTPFTKQSVRALRIIAILLLVNAVIPSVTDIAGISSIVNPPFLVAGLLFLFIAQIIRYGAMLQQESDETL